MHYIIIHRIIQRTLFHRVLNELNIVYSILFCRWRSSPIHYTLDDVDSSPNQTNKSFCFVKTNLLSSGYCCWRVSVSIDCFESISSVSHCLFIDTSCLDDGIWTWTLQRRIFFSLIVERNNIGSIKVSNFSKQSN